jgi:hypothetical protein
VPINFLNKHADEEKRKHLHWGMAKDALLDAVNGGSYEHAHEAMCHALETEGWVVS